MKAQLLNTLGKPEQAEKMLQQAVRIAPNFADVYFELAKIYESRRDRSVALMYFNQAAWRGHPAAKERLLNKANDN